jgi:hypothetical protein
MHAMGGRKPGKFLWENPCMAYAGAVQSLEADELSGDVAGALHEIEDSYASGHQYQPWFGYLDPAILGHLAGDALYIDAAATAAERYLSAYTNGNPFAPAADYLYPEPAGCN